MFLSKTVTFTAAVALASGLSLLSASRAAAQNTAPATPSVSTAPAGEPRQEGGGGDRREDFRQRMEERLKSQLKASDDEWTVIQPLVEKVYEKQRASGAFGGPGGPGGNREGGRRNREGGNNNAPQSADNNNQGGERPQRREGGGGPRGGTPETQALRAALENDNTTVNDIKSKLQAVRDQRKQATTELTQAREELRKVLNMRQEATLVMYGLLD